MNLESKKDITQENYFSYPSNSSRNDCLNNGNSNSSPNNHINNETNRTQNSGNFGPMGKIHTIAHNSLNDQVFLFIKY